MAQPSWPDIDLEALKVIDEDTDSFDIYVPGHCRADKPFGIYVHIPPGDGAMLPGYNQIFVEANIIAASPRNAGNGKDGFRRTVLVLACIETLKDQYLIDGNRVYVGGLSGGGIMSFIIHLLYPDIVRGSISHARGVGIEDRPAEGGSYHPSEVPFLSKARIGQIARLKHRWLFISGNKDLNYQRILDELLM